ncbi:MAG: transferrin-binding protein-like solute binding protein [Neisseriaceae bacterium]|nr:transferrin-binding protein-like solute binding protein [Neisseriaceae bacterium]
MQLKKLTLATLLALSLAACGGGDDDGTNQPVDPVGPTDPTDPAIDGGDVTVSDEELQPQNDVEDYAVPFKPESDPSVLSQVKVRRGDSRFDLDTGVRIERQYSNRMGSLSVSGSANGNRALTNIVLAQTVKKDDADHFVYIVGTDPFGNADQLHSQNSTHNHGQTTGGYPYTAADTFGTENPELQWLNAPNSVVAGATRTKYDDVGTAITQMRDTSGASLAYTAILPLIGDYAVGGSKEPKGKVTGAATSTYNGEFTLSVLDGYLAAAIAQLNDAANENALKDAKKDVEALQKGIKKAVENYEKKAGKNHGAGAIDVTALMEANNAQAWFAKDPETAPYTAGAPGLRFADGLVTADNPQEHGLVAINLAGDDGQIRGNDDNYQTNTRIFGHYYLDPGVQLFKDANGRAIIASEDYNSYLKAELAQVAFTDGSVDVTGGTNGHLMVYPTTLDHVQYGRVTAKLDPTDFYLQSNKAGAGGYFYRYAEVGPHLDAETVDTYFYRGTDETTIAQMDALTDNQIIYQGHAIMFGLDNSFHGLKTDGNVPTGVVENPNIAQGIGNFVEGVFDVGAKTFKGNVYNYFAYENNGKTEGVKDYLVEFGALVKGNTIAGDANLVYKPEVKGQIRGSFFGANASEIGGTFSGVSSTENKVDGEIRWGGAFGAHRVDMAKEDADRIIDSSEKLGK